jgi:putative tricarboxylic transport membrane protein
MKTCWHSSALLFGVAAQAAGRVHRAVQTGRRDGPDLQAGAKGLHACAHAKPPPSDMHITYLPGGIGAVAWHSLVSQRPRRAEYAGGVFRRLAAQSGAGQVRQGEASDVRWVAALGADYGMIAVRSRFALQDAGDLIGA